MRALVTVQNGLITAIWAIVDLIAYLATVGLLHSTSDAYADGLHPSPPDCELLSSKTSGLQCDI